MDNGTGIGARVKRKEDHRFLTGKGNYTDDINLPKQTYAYFVRCPHAHATIKKIDTSKAETGSSQMMSLGERARDLAMPTRCRWPPDNSWG